jgi:hypothetical protein
VPEHLKVVGPKLSLKVVSAKLSLSQNFARHSKFRVCARKLRRLPIIVLELLRAAGKGEWMPKVSNQVQRRIAELDAKYTVAQPKRAGRRVVALIILAIIAVAAFSYAHRTSSDSVQLTLKQGPAPAMLGAASTRFKSGE